jgi:hypothetical protein
MDQAYRTEGSNLPDTILLLIIYEISIFFCLSGYSFEWSSNKWDTCMDNANCLGGTGVEVQKGYWRKTTNSTKIIKCLYEDAWIGGYHPENENPVKWETGYGGVLCTQWQIIDGNKYERLSTFQWAKCPNLIYNTIRIFGLILLVCAFYITIIVVTVRKKKESQQSILLRILTNYFQLLTAALSFDLQFPKAITNAFEPISKLGASSEAFLSFDCFVQDTDIKWFAPSNAIFKVMLSGLLPFALIFTAFVTWGLLALCFKAIRADFVRYFVVTWVCTIFLFHPMLTKVGFEIFQCVLVDEGDYRVRIDIEMEWFSADHMYWAALINIPILIIWTFGCPIAVLIVLYRNRQHLDSPSIQKYFLFLFQGLTNKWFYWEQVNTARKILMAAINVFMSKVPIIYSACTAVLVLVFLLRLQIGLQPYKNQLNNNLEMEAMVSICI